MTAGLAIAWASLAAWIYLIAARGGFWRAAERDDREQSIGPRSHNWLRLPPRLWGRAMIWLRASRNRLPLPGGERGGVRGIGLPLNIADRYPLTRRPAAADLSPSGRGEEETAARSEPDSAEPRSWPAVAAVIPARNEADVVAESLGSLLRQDYPGPLTIILVDDQSRDGPAP